MSSLAEASTKEEQPQKPDEDEEQPAKKRARTDAAPVTDPEASDDAAPAPAPASGFAAHTSGGFGSFGGSSSGGFGSSSGGGFGGFSGGGFGGWDMSYMIGVAMLGAFVWQLGGGRDPDGWSAGKLWRRVQNLDFFQLLMLSNLLQQVLGGGRRRGYGGGFGRRSMFY